jgi:UDP-N-acetylmuramyl tripeptide synthase
MERLNVRANAATIAERFLFVAMDIPGGKRPAQEAMRKGAAALIVEAQSVRNLVQKIPTIVVAPQTLSLQRPNEKIDAIRRSQPESEKEKEIPDVML